jgi:tryptophan synthase alpha chain
MVSSSSTTGMRGGFDESQTGYFERINGMGLQNPTLIGFGISDHATFEAASRYARGAIIGSAFVTLLGTEAGEGGIPDFVRSIRGK